MADLDRPRVRVDDRGVCYGWRPATASYSSCGWRGLLWYERDIGGGCKQLRLMSPLRRLIEEERCSDDSRGDG